MRNYERLYETDEYAYFLRLFQEFDNEPVAESFQFKYCFDDNNLKQLKEKYQLLDIAGTGSQLRQLVNLMIWVNENLLGDGTCSPEHPINALSILEKTRSKKIKSNCYMFAVVLNEVFLSMGFYSRMVRCMPLDMEYNDCHCVTVAYVEEYHKWVVFDAANRAYYLNQKMEPVGLMEIRHALIAHEKIYIPMASRYVTRQIMNYWMKQLIRYECYAVSCFGAEDLAGDRIIYHLNPKLYCINDKTVSFPHFRLIHRHTSNPETFWSAPLEYTDKYRNYGDKIGERNNSIEHLSF